MLIDIHVHSSHTQGVAFSPAELVERAKEGKLDGICLTDINTLAGAAEIKRLGNKAQIVVLAGFEARTDHGHFLVFVPEPESLPDLKDWLGFDDQQRIVFDSLAQAVRSRAGVIVAARPFDRSIAESPGDGLAKLEGIAAIEVKSGGSINLADELAEEFAAGFGLPGVGGSNCRDDLKAIGKSATLLIDPVASEADLVDRILAGDVWPVTIGKLALPPKRARGPRKPGSERREPRGRGRPRRRDSRSGKPARPRRKKS